jgi:hypothetical protein
MYGSDNMRRIFKNYILSVIIIIYIVGAFVQLYDGNLLRWNSCLIVALVAMAVQLRMDVTDYVNRLWLEIRKKKGCDKWEGPIIGGPIPKNITRKK